MLNNIIATDDKLLILVALSIFFSGVLVFVIVIYNNIYTRKKSEYFMGLFYGLTSSNANYNLLKKNLNVTIYSFLLLYFLYSFKCITTANDVFPSRDNNIKPLKYFPNMYEEDIKKFNQDNSIWLNVNVIAFLFLVVSGFFVILYFILNQFYI